VARWSRGRTPVSAAVPGLRFAQACWAAATAARIRPAARLDRQGVFALFDDLQARPAELRRCASPVAP
jgi:hypothetical protein